MKKIVDMFDCHGPSWVECHEIGSELVTAYLPEDDPSEVVFTLSDSTDFGERYGLIRPLDRDNDEWLLGEWGKFGGIAHNLIEETLRDKGFIPEDLNVSFWSDHYDEEYGEQLEIIWSVPADMPEERAIEIAHLIESGWINYSDNGTFGWPSFWHDMAEIIEEIDKANFAKELDVQCLLQFFCQLGVWSHFSGFNPCDY